jgi:uncharacterized protein YqeY
MDNEIAVLKSLYAFFNARHIDGVLGALTDDVAWANGMEGGHVHGHSGVREYWTRQWAIVSPHVEPVGFARASDGSIVVEALQSVRDLQGRPLQDQTHGLRDKTVGHVFRFRDGKVTRFDIRETPPDAGATDAVAVLRARIADDLRQGMKERDKPLVAVLRVLLGVLDNAGAVDASLGQRPAFEISGDVPRRSLNREELLALLQSEMASRVSALREYERTGQQAYGERLRAELAVLRRYAHG